QHTESGLSDGLVRPILYGFAVYQWTYTMARQAIGHGSAGIVQNRGQQIDAVVDQVVIHLPPPCRRHLGIDHDERYTRRLFVEDPLLIPMVRAVAVSMIRREQDDSVVGKP